MVDPADVCRRFAHDHLARHGDRMPPSHRRAIADIIACRSAALGGHLWRCAACRAEVYAYHSCRNRSCPRCHRRQSERWPATRTTELLDAPCFHITITVPAELRAVLRANQRDGYALLMKAAAAAIIELARDPRYVGAQVGVLAVLHTCTQSGTTTRTSPAWSPAAASPATADSGRRQARASWCRSRRSPGWPAASSKTPSHASGRT